MNKELKNRHLIEIKELQSEYSRHLERMNYIQELQKDVLSRIEIILNKFKNDK